MNPFIFPPRQIPNAAAASYVLSLYDREIADSIAETAAVQEQLAAIVDALRQAHPDLNLDLLIDTALNVGQLAGTREDLDITKGQFRASLPMAIRKALEQPSQP